MRFIGDIHGKLDQYKTIIDSCDESIQVGDYGIGFVDNTLRDTNHKFIRGNHDNPKLCKKEPNWIKDGTFEDDIFYIGGASSIDRAMRYEGVNWWRDEQLSFEELYNLYQKYSEYKPDIVVSHECPDIISDSIMSKAGLGKFKDNSRTRDALQNMFMLHKPKLWIFGHWHFNFDEVILGTRFICLNELSYIDIDMDDLSKGEIKKGK
jgi:hypothetical protein